ncbi:MAG: helix-turn-helix domain-containing protein [Alphaproteobacteria bacterium]|nr:helix-turn-helix domain-containing protein [Alphaproteobacteria bacterium]MDP6812207.1 helix-turn-helix domain-containing protein [Alphaproteobacteria bacterium]
MEHTTKGAAFTELVLETFRLNGLLLAAGDRLGADIGLTSARWQVMGALAETSRTVPQIARQMGLTRQGAQRTVNVLLTEGLVEQRPNPDHKRAMLIGLTAEGRRRLEQVSNRQIQWANGLGAAVNAADMRTVLRVARALRTELEGS